MATSTIEGLESKSLGVGKALGKVVTGEGRFNGRENDLLVSLHLKMKSFPSFLKTQHRH